MSVKSIKIFDMFSGHQIEVEYDDGHTELVRGDRAKRLVKAIEEAL